MAGVEQQRFGTAASGTAVELYTLRGRNGFEASVMTYGATLVSVRAPDRNGVSEEVTLGFDELAPYLDQHPYFGCVVGRYANRIAGAEFRLNDRTYRLAQNDGPNHLHGGLTGFGRVLWQGYPETSNDAPAVRFAYLSRAGEEGYPGTVEVEVTYTVNDRNELRLEYLARADADTLMNLTNHAYFNLSGRDTILGHHLRLHADRFLPIDERFIPTGEMREVAGTAFDFRKATAIGARIAAEDPQVRRAGGYDHCWMLNKEDDACSLAAELHDPDSGRTLSVLTTQPGIQIYTSNFAGGTIRGRGGQFYARHAGVCLETQHFPDSPHQSSFPTTILRRGGIYRHRTVFSFGVRG